ncbi:MAG: DEAD/DEAH box helicase family protein, partial [Selenomonadaceae bacterium]|nr:DEAD/DEAH box helicase family protein [Selenomonadaceae bacterium]
MILKDYQAQAIRNLEDFLRLLDENKPISEAFKNFWASRDVNARPPYQNNIPHVPQVCFKVPTGGGKTFMATSSLKVIFNALPTTQSKVVVWLVPSEIILNQTYKNLSEPTHPYHRALDEDFSGQFAVYTKEQLLAAENFSPAEVAEQLSILVLSYDSFRTSNKEGRKAYQQNGQLNQFVAHFHDSEKFLSGADESSLIQVIRHYRPVVIVDESHHATTTLSIEMLQNFNPSFILELTATPKKNSNVIAYVPAAKLKANGMVKLPVIVYNRHTQDDVISDAIDFRNLLEQVGQTENIRPIILFQAESQGKGDRITFDRIKNELIQNHNIPAEQIAIKTADINNLKNIDLMASDCLIRYIITINALKEGWDCPFAYILASLANRTSTIDVEQILGRILRRPFTKNFSNELLNMSYVFTSSADFRQTLDKIVVGLNAAGFSEHEYRAITDS